MHKCIVLVASLFVLFAGVHSALGRLGPVPDANEEYIYGQDSIASVYNNPPLPTVFTINEPQTITKLGSYHWNDGNGQIPGTLGLQDQNGKIYGPWQTSDPQGQGGAPAVYWWLTIPNGGVDLPAGKYTVLDSDPSTWSYNSETDNCGAVAVVGLKSSKGDVQLSGNWKMAGHQTGFNDWEADLTLNTDGTLSWTETKGASVGATRTGTWLFDGTTFTMTWISPTGGNTRWISLSVTVNYMGDGTYTVEEAPGGTWTATRTAANATPIAPCAGTEGVTDLSIGSPTSAGPSLAPGSYNIWYGKRTGDQIGYPDSWSTVPVTLLGGKCYLFDVSTGTCSDINPPTILMMQNPTPSESVVWYKASTRYAYAVCVEGPLDTSNKVKAPCAGDGAVDLSPRSPTDLYTAGPGLVPGSYNIWYGKRTGTNIGIPDTWNTCGPVKLLDGTFYVFDVTTGKLNSVSDPNMIKGELPKPSKGEAVVWYKCSTQYAYVTCFEGPIVSNGGNDPGQGQLHKAALSPGWDTFSEPLSNGKVLWAVFDNRNLQVIFELNGASPNHKYIVGAHFFDPGGSSNLSGACQFGGWKIGCGRGPLTREGKTVTGIGAWDFGYLETDGTGYGKAQFNLTPPPGIYYVQFTVRIGDKCDPSGGITSGCAAVYRTGDKCGEGLEVISI